MSPSDHFSACSQAIADFYAALDGLDAQPVGSFFTADGVWLRQGERLVGPQAVDAALARRPGGRRSLHLLSNLRLTDQGEGRVLARYLVQTLRHDATEAGSGPRPLDEALFAVMHVDEVWQLQADGAPRLLEKKGQTLFRRGAAVAAPTTRPEALA